MNIGTAQYKCPIYHIIYMMTRCLGGIPYVKELLRQGTCTLFCTLHAYELSVRYFVWRRKKKKIANEL